MSRGKHLSLEEARKEKKLAQFIKEHPSEADKVRFEAVLGAMCGSPPKDDQTSDAETSED
jgi:cupin superfamily acireductone dioxygenase involved in methionine salvage